MNGLSRKFAGRDELLSSPLERTLRSFFAGLPGFPDFTLFDSKVEVETTDDEVILRMPSPGCDKSDFTIELVGDYATIKVARRREVEEPAEPRRYLYRERSVQEFEESVKLPVPVVPQEARAGYVDGVLTLTIPREKQPKPERKSIKITTE